MITISNLRNSKPQHPWQVRVDRSSVLGNPFPMKSESFRDHVCDLYESYFAQTIHKAKTSDDPKAQNFIQELRRLYKIHRTYGKLELFCWCAPKRCHAETIKAFLERFITELPKEPEVYHKPCSQDWVDEPLTGYEMGLV